MEGLLHPVGPEDVRTYWIRRGMALLVLVVLVTGFTSVVSSLGGPKSSATPPEVAAVPEQTRPVREDSSRPATVPVGTVPAAVASEEAVPVPSSAKAQAPAAQAPAAMSDPAVVEPLPPEPANTFHLPTAPATASAGQPAPAHACDSQAIRVQLEGPRAVKAGVAVTFKVTATNNGDRDCVVQIDAATFDLTVTSGGGRVWSSRDCAAGMPPRSAALAPGRTLEWQVEWPASRSVPPCTTDPEMLPVGTYVAVARLGSAQHAQVIMELAA